MKTLLSAALLLMLFSPSARALECVQPTLARDVAAADIVFEGRLVKIDRDTDIVRGNDTSHFEELTYYVMKPYKGVKAGDVVKAIQQVWMPLSDSAKNWVETQGDMQQGLVALKKADAERLDLVAKDEDYYFIGMCGLTHYPATPENLKIVAPLSKP